MEWEWRESTWRNDSWQLIQVNESLAELAAKYINVTALDPSSTAVSIQLLGWPYGHELHLSYQNQCVKIIRKKKKNLVMLLRPKARACWLLVFSSELTKHWWVTKSLFNLIWMFITSASLPWIFIFNRVLSLILLFIRGYYLFTFLNSVKEQIFYAT